METINIKFDEKQLEEVVEKVTEKLKKDSQQYINSLNYFEYARMYFEKNGFPDDNRRVYQSGKRKGQKVGWSDKEEKQQKEDIKNFIHEKQLQKFKSQRKSK